MIQLERIEISNFRSLGDVDVTVPLDANVIAITGPNGSGKSSILAALAWALYGSVPEGMKVKDLRRQGTSKDDAVSVTATFKHRGQTITCTRSLKGSQDATVAAITVDGVDVTNVSATTARDWVTQRLGVNFDGFLAAVMVRQKELDALVQVTPKERRARIQHLAGIDSLEQALADARQEATTRKRILDSTPDVTSDLDTAREDLDTSTAAAAAAQKAAEQAHAAAATADAVFTQVQRDGNRIADAQTAAAAHQATITTNETAAAGITATLTQTRQRIQQLTNDTAGITATAVADAADTVTTIDEQLAALDRDSVTHQDTVNAHQRTLMNVDAKRAALQRALTAQDQAAAHVTHTQAALDTFNLPALRDAITSADAALDTANRLIGEHQADVARLTTAINTLTASHNPACPTCTQPLVDLDDLVQRLTADRDTATTALTAARAAAEQAATDAADARARAHQAQSTAADATAATQHLTAATTAVTVAETDVAEAEKAAAEEADTAAAAAAALAQVQHTRNTLLASRDTAVADHHRVQQLHSQAQEIPALTHTCDNLTRDLAQHRDAITAARSAITELNIPTADELQRRRQEWSEAQSALIAANQTASQRQADADTLTSRAAAAADRVAELTATQDRRSHALAEAEIAVAVRDSMDQFRKERLARLAPELAEIATDIVASVTAGKYVTVELDENFTPTVTDSTGDKRPIGWLSGGEESVVAFALRVAVGEILAQSGGGLLILDEVLTAQDVTRRDAMMAVIRNLPGRQIITINHVAEAADLGDVTYRVTGCPGTVEPVISDTTDVDLNAIEAVTPTPQPI